MLKKYFGDINPVDLVKMEESAVPVRTVPPVLVKNDGTMVANAWDWLYSRRPEVLDFYSREIFGQWLPRPDKMICQTVSEKPDALDGLAVRKEIRITFFCGQREHSILMLLYIPAGAGEKTWALCWHRKMPP